MKKLRAWNFKISMDNNKEKRIGWYAYEEVGFTIDEMPEQTFNGRIIYRIKVLYDKLSKLGKL